MKFTTLALAGTILSVLCMDAMAYTTCDLPNPSCSGLAATCKAFNKKAGADASRCDGYKAACMQTGQWQDRNCSRSNVAKR
jgi:hypothetical protein